MRNFRKAALAGATALAVAFGSTSVAVAQENNGSSNLSSQFGGILGVDTNPESEINQKPPAQDEVKDQQNWADGTALFGSSKSTTEDTPNNGNFTDQPLWAKLFYGGTIFAAVAGFVGMVVGPLYNYVVHGM
ncbi:hypothetical protein [Corynebacterium sp.]|uniref:hypothetical protein n=1 Tax=Corynebacterium sp. TaxID=1720 RepID=UPI00373696C1